MKHEANAKASTCPGAAPHGPAPADALSVLRVENRGAQWTGPWEVPEAPP